MLEKAAAIKRFEKTVNVETKKEYQKLHIVYDFDKIINKEKTTLENYIN